jgi:tRNA(Ile)-lysidine synthetase-like protein
MSIADLKKFWFANSQLWFNCTPEEDNTTKNMFGFLLDLDYDDLLNNEHLLCSIRVNFEINIEYNEKPKTELANTFYNNLLEMIILHDQISRHVYRSSKDKKEIISYHDEIAYNYCSVLLPYIDKYLPEERCFILMPLRHTFIESNLIFCLRFINKWREENDLPIYKRFYEATVNSLINLNNEKSLTYIPANYTTDLDQIYDPSSCRLLDICFQLDEIKETKIYKEFYNNLKNIKEDKLVVSISGGVDSMVCSLLLHAYTYNTNIKPLCVCINYNNRPEQYLEVEMVNRWLTYLQIPLYVRNITEITRTRDKDREFYEKVTRNIRFEAYKKLNAPIILGHNKDDSVENIFSNIIKKNNYNNLLGMTVIGKEQDVTILRPLLNITKKEILDFANIFNVPYVYDSTPKWSERGKMRDILIPNIKKFNPQIIEGLIMMAYNFSEIYSVCEKLLPNIDYYKNKCIVEDKNIYFFDYWRQIYFLICKHYNKPNIKSKSIINFINNIKYGNRITLSKNMIAVKVDDKIIIYL